MILKIRDADGNVQEVVAIRGKKGDKPVKGEDYFTEADIVEIAKLVIAMLPEWKGGDY